MQKRFVSGSQHGRSLRWYAGIALAVIIGCGFVGSGWFSSPESSRSAVGTLSLVATDAPSASVKPQADFGKLPLYFVENRGQVDKQVAYYVHGRDTQVYLTTQGLTFVLSSPPVREDSKLSALPHELKSSLPTVGEGQREGAFRPVSLTREETKATSRYILKLDFVGSNPHVQPQGEEQTEAVISYFKGEQDQWRTGLKTYQKVVYPDLWPGIDLVYSGDSRQLKYTFVVKPGADPKQIQLAYRGATDVTLSDSGQLQIHTPEKLLTEDKPYTYQEIDGNRVEVASAYQLTQSTPRNTHDIIRDMEAFSYSFQLGTYDVSRPLVIDPVVLVYAGYIGGGDYDESKGIAVDSAGNVYVTGYTDSTPATFPETVGPSLVFRGGPHDAFVAKVRAGGTSLVYAGYLGGVGDDYGYGIAVDRAGSAYVTGYTSGGFPVKVGPSLTFNGNTDAFVAKVRADGTSLVYAGYLGGGDYDAGVGIAVDSTGNAYVTGNTRGGLPVIIGPDLSHNGGFYDAFVAKVRADGTSLVYAGYLGGDSGDYGYGIAVDRAGNAYVTGFTSSTQATFPVKVGPDLSHNGGINDGFVAKVRADGTSLVYAGYLGGSADELSTGIAVDSAGSAYVTGRTSSTEETFPVKVGPDLTFNISGYYDGFVAKVRADGTSLVYAGYLGGKV